MDFISEKERKTPVVRDVDVAVAGGGFGGIAAALAAARQGKKVVLLEREFALGGLGTLGLVTIYLPLCDGNGNQVSFGIAEELFRLSISRGADVHCQPYPACWLEEGTKEERIAQRYRVQYYPWFFVCDVEQLLLREGVEILYGTSVCDAVTENGRITALILDNIDGRTAVRVKTVVDATGSAVVCKLAGEDTRVYANGNVPSSWYYYLSEGVNKLNMFGPKDYRGASLDAALRGVRFSGLDAKENSEMLIFSHQKMIEDVEKIRVNEPTAYPSLISGIQQLRMTRGVEGVEEFRADRVGSYCETSIGCIGRWNKPDAGHEIPYGSLFGHKIKNLITAGRCTCADTDGWNLTRVIPACAVTGEAAGIAASLTDDFASLPVGILQNELEKAGVRIHLP